MGCKKYLDVDPLVHVYSFSFFGNVYARNLINVFRDILNKCSEDEQCQSR